jgi:2'-5' RNA ligase
MKFKDYFIGIFPDQKAIEKLTDFSAKVAEIFSTQGIPVRWMRPEKYHVTVLYVGKNINIVRKMFVSYRLKRYSFKSFDITLGHIKLGISKKYRELVLFTVEGGADDLRDLVLDLEGKIKVQREFAFIPHVSLGRVSKDLSDMEFKNLTDDIARLNEEVLRAKPIKFHASKLYFMESDLQTYKEV